MPKLKICVSVNLNDQEFDNLNTVEEFDTMTSNFYAKTRLYLDLLFNDELEPKEQVPPPYNHILFNSINIPARYEITGVHKDVTA